MCPASGRNDSLAAVQRDQEPRSGGRRSETWTEEDDGRTRKTQLGRDGTEHAVSSLSGLVAPWGHKSRALGCPLMGGADPKQDACPIFAFMSNTKVFFFPFSFIQSSHMHLSSLELMATLLE